MQTITYRTAKIWEMNEEIKIKILSKNQVCALFHMRDIRKNVLPKYGDAMLVSLWEAQIWRPESNRNIGL